MIKKPNSKAPESNKDANYRMRLAGALNYVSKQFDECEYLPELDCTEEDLGLKPIKMIMPDTWMNISELVQTAVEKL